MPIDYPPERSRRYPPGGPPSKLQYPVIPAKGQTWRGLTKPDTYSRWTIDDAGADDLINYIPIGNELRAVPASGATIASLPGGTAIWMTAVVLNAGTYLFVLSTNGHIYQISLGGAVTDINAGGGFAATCDITEWQGTTILISDSVAQKVYSWNGTTFSTVFTSQPAQFIAVFSSRLWMANNSTVTFTAGGTFNSLGGDSGSFIITDEDCVNPIIHLMSLQGQLWIFGSNWIQVLGNLQDIGAPAILTFTKYVLEAQVSIINRWSIIPYGSYVYWANSYGIWLLQGGLPTDLSDNINGFFQNLDQVLSSWSGAYGMIYGVPCMFWHVKFLGDNTNTILCLNIATGKWFRTTDGSMSFIAGMVSSTITNSNPTAWATDGTNIFQLYANTTTPVVTQFNSKLWNYDNPIRYKNVMAIAAFVVINTQANMTAQILDRSGNVKQTINPTPNPVTPGTFTLINNVGGVLQLQNNSLGNLTLVGSGTVLMFPFQFDSPTAIDRMIGINLSITSVSHVLCFISFEMEETEMYFGD